jgi:hypothetical protein
MHADTAKPANPVVNMDKSPGSGDGAGMLPGDLGGLQLSLRGSACRRSIN